MGCWNVAFLESFRAFSLPRRVGILTLKAFPILLNPEAICPRFSLNAYPTNVGNTNLFAAIIVNARIYGV